VVANPQVSLRRYAGASSTAGGKAMREGLRELIQRLVKMSREVAANS
jgi:hypothetical protein